MTGVSVSRARIQVTVRATRLDRSKFDKQLKMIGDVDVAAPFDFDTSITLCDTPIMLFIGLWKKAKQTYF